MNDFNEKQNSNDLLSLLKLQRYIYNNVSIIATISFVISVVIPTILSFIGLLKLPENYITYINYIGAICTVICLWLSSKLKIVKENAAKVQYLFDIQLFQLKQNSFICGNTLTEYLSLSRKKAIQKQKGLENWYSINRNLNLNEAIFSCQRQNIRWDKKLRKLFFICILVACLISIFVITTIAITKNLKINIIWSYIFLLMPIIAYCLSFIFLCIDNLKEQNELSEIFNSYKTRKNISIKELTSLEEKIFYYRKNLVKIPNWFFKIFRNSMQKEADNFSQIEKETHIKS